MAMAIQERSSYAQVRGCLRHARKGDVRLMPYFPVDDSFHSHPKPMAASLAAIGLWTVAGSWSSDHLRDGFVPDHVVSSLSRGQVELAKELVGAGLWRRTRGGYQFHEWDADGDGTPRNQTRSEAIAKRSKMASGGVLGNHRRWHMKKGVTDPTCVYCQDKHDRPPNRVPDRGGESGGESPPNPSVPIPSQSPKGTREGAGSQSSSRRNARGPDDDTDDFLDRFIVELLAELTSQTVTLDHAADVRHRITDGQTIRTTRRAYIRKSIENEPDRWLPAASELKPDDAGPPPLRTVQPWCGHCDADDYRWIQGPDGRWTKCQQCNPDAPYPYTAKEVS